MIDHRGLHQKFIVRRVDRTDAAGGKHDGCNYFVLDLDHDKHAIAALKAYAKNCKEERPQLSRDLMAIVEGNSLMPYKTQLP